jgi:hypothetical protein
VHAIQFFYPFIPCIHSLVPYQEAIPRRSRQIDLVQTILVFRETVMSVKGIAVQRAPPPPFFPALCLLKNWVSRNLFASRVTPPPRYHIYYYTAPRSSGYTLEAATHPRRHPPRVRVPLEKPADELQKKKKTQVAPCTFWPQSRPRPYSTARKTLSVCDRVYCFSRWSWV